MQCIIHDGERYMIRLDNGEEAITSLIKFCQEHQITAGFFSMIGASRDVVLAYYNIPEKKYEDHQYQKDMEIVGVQGNVGVVEERTIIHAHGSFSDQQLNVWAGHVKRLVVSATAEVALTVLKGTINRKLDEASGLRHMVAPE